MKSLFEFLSFAATFFYFFSPAFMVVIIKKELAATIVKLIFSVNSAQKKIRQIE